jgi:hypothetical protein
MLFFFCVFRTDCGATARVIIVVVIFIIIVLRQRYGLVL